MRKSHSLSTISTKHEVKFLEVYVFKEEKPIFYLFCVFIFSKHLNESTR